MTMSPYVEKVAEAMAKAALDQARAEVLREPDTTLVYGISIRHWMIVADELRRRKVINTLDFADLTGPEFRKAVVKALDAYAGEPDAQKA